METDSLRALVALGRFEALWAYCSLTEGQYRHQECSGAAQLLLAAMRDLRLPVDSDDGAAPDLASWAAGDPSALPRLLADPARVTQFIDAARRALSEKTSAEPFPAAADEAERLFRTSFVRWQAHVPTVLLLKMGQAEEILEKASASETIVVVGDIRRSQDLMTYARTSQSFMEYMAAFIKQMRGLIEDNCGLFDKFTGDGFLAYFNESVCAMMGRDHQECFLEFLKYADEFSKEHFARWSESIRKVPDVEVGLCVGADVGRVGFQDLDSHFMAVGDSIVWAKRLADAGGAGEIVLNNLLYHALKGRTSLSFSERQEKTKSGEPFLARLMHFAKDNP